MESLVGTFRILQPGSSVACSLSASESSMHPKHMSFFEIKGRKFRLKPIPYTQVRPFVYDEITLKKVEGLDTTDPKFDDKVRKALRSKITMMIHEAKLLATNCVHRDCFLNFPPIFKLVDPEKVLVRLKVDHEGFANLQLNPQRFGAEFVGQVANPADILLMSKKRKEGGRGDNAGGRMGTAKNELRQLIAEGAGEDEISKIKIEDLVAESLRGGGGGRTSLAILQEADMAAALDDFISRKTTTALQEMIIENVEKLQKKLIRDQGVQGDGASIRKAAETARGGSSAAPGSAQQGNGGDADRRAADEDAFLMDVDEDDNQPQRGRGAGGRAGRGAAATGRGRGRGGRAAGTSRAAATTSRRKKKDEDDDDDDENELDDDDDDDRHTSKKGKSAAAPALVRSSRAKVRHSKKVFFKLVSDFPTCRNLQSIRLIRTKKTKKRLAMRLLIAKKILMKRKKKKNLRPRRKEQERLHLLLLKQRVHQLLELLYLNQVLLIAM